MTLSPEQETIMWKLSERLLVVEKPFSRLVVAPLLYEDEAWLKDTDKELSSTEEVYDYCSPALSKLLKAFTPGLWTKKVKTSYSSPTDIKSIMSGCVWFYG